MVESKHRASISVSYHALRLALGLPADVDIVRVISQGSDQFNDTIQIVVEHPNFPARGSFERTHRYDDIPEMIRAAKGDS
jgi:hypothetical protein